MSAIFPTIAVIVVNWNGWRDTVKAYTSLRGSSYTGWRLIIVDNASTDDSPAQLSDLGPKATLIANSENAGVNHNREICSILAVRGRSRLVVPTGLQVPPIWNV